MDLCFQRRDPDSSHDGYQTVIRCQGVNDCRMEHILAARIRCLKLASDPLALDGTGMTYLPVGFTHMIGYGV